MANVQKHNTCSYVQWLNKLHLYAFSKFLFLIILLRGPRFELQIKTAKNIKGNKELGELN